MSLLEARELTLSADVGGTTVEVLRDLTLSLDKGRVVGLVGESGAGKSMVGRLISQLLPPGFGVTAGSLTFQGEDLIGLRPERRLELLGRSIAFIPQEPITSLNPVLTIGRQMGEHLARLGVRGRRARRAQAGALLDAVHLPDPDGLLDKYPHQLSGGMCQRVLIAMAFAGDPPLIVADEPTTALDVMTQAHIMGLIAEMQADHGTAVIFITHDLRLAAQVCDDLLVLYAGEVVEAGPAKAVFSEPRHPYTQCLQRANPSLTGARRHLANLPEHMPGLTGFAALRGCRFAPRCPIADDACARARPARIDVAPRHWVRCTPGCLNTALPESAAAAALAPAAPSSSPAPPIVALEGVSKRFATPGGLFGRAGSFTAVDNVSIAIHPGEFVGIVGESGSGKSTVARLIMGLETPSAGRILINGEDMSAASAAQRAARIDAVQMVFQDPQSALNPRRLVASTITQAMEAGARHATWRERLERTAELLRETGLPPETARRFPSQLSGGQRQRVNIARALCTTPRLLVADEIVSGLDVSVQAQILNLLLRLRSELDVALLFISHDLSVVRYLCERVAVMHDGRIVEAGTTDEVFANPQADYTKALLSAVPPDDPHQRWAPLEAQSASGAA